MKKNILKICLISTIGVLSVTGIVLAAISLSKANSVSVIKGETGDPGEDGKDGENGTNGTDGVDGKDGQDGSSFLTGEGVPSSELGKDGDAYLDTSSGTLYSKTDGVWTILANMAIKHTVTLNLDGGSLDSGESTILVNDGATITLPIPSKSEYEFMGWFNEETFENEFDETTLISDDLTLYAKREYVGSFDVDDFTLYDSGYGYIISSYNGSDNNVVVPAYYN